MISCRWQPSWSSWWHAPTRSWFQVEILWQREKPKTTGAIWLRAEHLGGICHKKANPKRCLSQGCPRFSAASQTLTQQHLNQVLLLPPPRAVWRLLELQGGMEWVPRGAPASPSHHSPRLGHPSGSHIQPGSRELLGQHFPTGVMFLLSNSNFLLPFTSTFCHIKKTLKKYFFRKWQTSFIFPSSQHSSFPHLSAALLLLPLFAPLGGMTASTHARSLHRSKVQEWISRGGNIPKVSLNQSERCSPCWSTKAAQPLPLL